MTHDTWYIIHVMSAHTRELHIDSTPLSVRHIILSFLEFSFSFYLFLSIKFKLLKIHVPTLYAINGDFPFIVCNSRRHFLIETNKTGFFFLVKQYPTLRIFFLFPKILLRLMENARYEFFRANSFLPKSRRVLFHFSRYMVKTRAIAYIYIDSHMYTCIRWN